MTRTGSRSYRTSIEVLRDLLTATQVPSAKSRVIGAANLNRRSFQAYLRFCLDHELICRSDGHYVTSSRGTEVVGAIEVVLKKSGELDNALELLQRRVGVQPVSAGTPGVALRPASRRLWNELVPVGNEPVHPARSGGFASRTPEISETETHPPVRARS